jgi:hypothetical protein
MLDDAVIVDVFGTLQLNITNHREYPTAVYSKYFKEWSNLNSKNNVR